MAPSWSSSHHNNTKLALSQEIPLKLAAATIIFTSLAFVTTIYLSLNTGIRTYPIAIEQHSFSISNATKPISTITPVWDGELKFSHNTDLKLFIQHFEGFVFCPKFKPLWCASLKPVESKAAPNGRLVVRFDMRGCEEEALIDVLMEVRLEMKMELVLPYQFGKTRVWGWLWGLSVEESCSELRVEFESLFGEGKLIGEGGWCFVPLPE